MDLAPLLRSFRNFATSDVFDAYRLLLLLPQSGQVHLQVEGLLGNLCDRRGGPRPTTSIQFLESLSSQGIDARPYCDAVADARASHAVAPSTAITYDSHMRQIGRACKALGEVALPANLDTIRRVTSVVGHPDTLRGRLAAWRRLHCFARLPWAGDHDVFLLAVWMDLKKRLGPVPPRMRCRRPLLRLLLAAAVKFEAWEAGAFAALAYTFGLRAPSELVRQATRE